MWTLLFESTIDTTRTNTDELSNLLFVVSLSIQLPNPLMKTHSLALTGTTLLCSSMMRNSQHDEQELVSEKPDCSNERLRGRAITRLRVAPPGHQFRLLSSLLVKLDMRILMHKLFLNRCVISFF